MQAQAALDPDFVPFRDYCRANGIGVTTGYKLVKDGKIKLCHIGKRSYLTREEREAFRAAVVGGVA